MAREGDLNKLGYIETVFRAYGAFFLLRNPATNSLLLLATLLEPVRGLTGFACGLTVLLLRRLCGFASLKHDIDVVNGILVGLLIGSFYQPGLRTLFLVVLGALLVLILSNMIAELKQPRLPVLGTPFVLVAFLVIAVAISVRLPLAPLAPSADLTWLPHQANSLLRSLGSFYFCGSPTGGLLVLLALAIASPYLSLLAVTSGFLTGFMLEGLGLISGTHAYIAAQMNGVLTAIIVGGLFSAPGARSLTVALICSAVAGVLSISLTAFLWSTGMPVLALPFLVTTYGALFALGGHHSTGWSSFWLYEPALPELSMERLKLAGVRGVDARSVALKAPVSGTWQIYQGFSGPYTHQPPWQYALDLFMTRAGMSFSGEGKRLSEYFCFGKPVVSPCSGQVVDMRDDLPDNRPGEVDLVNNWGNFLLIKLDYGAGFVLLSHLRKGSVKVEPFTRVVPGELLAEVGNSGRSPQPHLHIHVQESELLGSSTLPFHLTCLLELREGGCCFSLNCRPREGSSIARPPGNSALLRALTLPVGKRLEYALLTDRSGSTISRSVEVALDVNGQFYLDAGGGCRTAFYASEDLIAMFDRQGGPDLFLDSLILAIGLTPFADGEFEWQDAPCRALLPLSVVSRLKSRLISPFSSLAESSYRRRWDSSARVWIQEGQHRAPGSGVRVSTEARLCESTGLSSFSLSVDGEIKLMATLAGSGSRADNGLPGWIARTLPALK